MMLMGHGDDLVICDINHSSLDDRPSRDLRNADRLFQAAVWRALPQRSLRSFRSTLLSKNAFAIVRTSDPGPYGCFILKMGTV
ncbi:L-fucose mutarotase/ribose pyranase (RbsD/FucU family) [Rhizobium mongolense]|uniref:L-fucose mutarotase/ribose pyranase (RbsD/FucU family) n=1 Tax=Rhizobium mongolense TaxID=57676 RepID=A0A7W6RJF3_9HYPH|nr:L-fucose mutarotase/ribose pyranase (RbsD/FucU family) [Rhizobium mongolense]